MSEENQVSPEIIAEAEQGGWVPLEKFRDDESKWVDAETFVKRGREINPILRKHNAELKKQIEAIKREAQEAIDAAKDFREFQKTNFEAKKAQLEAEITRLKEAKKEALTDHDGERAVAIDDAIDDLKEQKSALKEPVVKQKEEPATEKADPTLQSWLDKNKWFGEDQSMTRRTNALGVVIREEFPELQGQAFLDKLDEEVRKTYPDKFKREKGPDVEGVTSSGKSASGNGKTWKDLPAEAKQAADRFYKQGFYGKMTQDQARAAYVAEYDWS